MRKLILLTSLILIIGSVFATMHGAFQVPSNRIGGIGDIGIGDIGIGDIGIGDIGIGDSGTGGGSNTGSFTLNVDIIGILPANVTFGTNANLLDNLIDTNYKSECIDKENILEVRCIDSSGSDVAKLPTECIADGAWQDPYNILSNLQTGFQQPSTYSEANYCYSDSLKNYPIRSENLSVRAKDMGLLDNPKNGDLRWYTKNTNNIPIGQSFPNDCEDMDYSIERFEKISSNNFKDLSGSEYFDKRYVNDLSKVYSIYDLEPLCIANDVNGNEIYLDETFIENTLEKYLSPYAINTSIMDPLANFNDLTYEVKCNLVNDFNDFISNHEDPASYCVEIDLGTTTTSKISQYQIAAKHNVLCKDNTVADQNIQPVPSGSTVTVFNNINFITWVSDSKIGSGQLSEVYFYDDFETLEYEQKDLEWESIYEITAECLENPINPKVSISLKNYPDYVIKNNIIPINQPVIFDVSKTTPSNFLVYILHSWYTSNNAGVSGVSQVQSQNNPELTFSSEGEVNSTLRFTSDDYKRDFSIILESKEIINTNIETNLASNNIIPGELITFVLTANTFDGAEIVKVSFDPGQREESYGQMVPISGQFQCRESSTVSCSLNDAEYEGVPVAGSPCSCRPDSIYLGQFTADKDDTGFKRAFDADEFSYTFPMSYPSKSSCGPTRVCEVVFEVEDINGVSSEFILDLNMPGIQTCSNSYSNSIVGTNSSLYVGSINDGEQTCQCKFGYEPKIDDALSQLTGQSTKSCKQIPPKKTNTTNTTNTYIPTSPTQGYSNPTYTKQQTRSYSDSQNTDIFSNESEEKGYGFLIFGLFIVLGAGTIGGFEFYERKKTGSFVNPLNNIKSLIKKKDKFDDEDKSDYKVSPIQKFITDARKAGETNDTIRQNLINSGWPEEEINKFL